MRKYFTSNRLPMLTLMIGVLAVLTLAITAVASRKVARTITDSKTSLKGAERSKIISLRQSVQGSSVPEKVLTPTDAQQSGLDTSFGVDSTVATDLGTEVDDSASAVAVQFDGKVIAVGYVSSPVTGKDFAVIRLNSDGTLDPTFSDDGRLTFNFNSGAREDVARGVAIQPDGRIVIAGEADVSGFGNFDVVLARLNIDGSFDTSFGNNGRVVTNLPGNGPDYGRGVVVQTDGKILVAGYSSRAVTGDDFVVLKYNSNGSLDSSFDGDGIAITDILSNREDRAAAISVQSDGRILVAGYTNSASFKRDFALVRYDQSGSLDSTLNGTGKVTTDLNLNSEDFGNAVTVQSDGKILVAGQSASEYGLVRYNSNGTPDLTFGGGDGIVITGFGTGSTNIGRAVVVQSNGKITVAGRSRSELSFARYDPGGTLDNSFGRGGLLVQNAGNNYISGFGGYWGMALQADGKIVAAGDGWRDGFRNEFTVSRLNANGSFDLSFGGGDGISSTDVNGRFDEARSIAIQPDGKIVVGGSAQNATGGFDFAVARYNADGTPDTSFGAAGISTTDINGHNNDHGFAVALQADGKILLAGYTNNAGDGLVDDAALLRYNPNGTLDGTFGSGGVAIFAHGPNSLSWLRYKSIAVQSDGRIVVAGEAHYFSIYSDGIVARYNANGTFDSTFGGGTFEDPPRAGVTLVHYADIATFNSVALQSDGKAVLAGSVNDGPAADFALARVTLSGALDASFGSGGKVTTNFSNGNLDAAYDIAIQPDGRVVAAGETIASGTGSNFGVARYNPNGSLDTTFGGGMGTANIDFLGYRDYCVGIGFQPDGKIVLAGFADDQITTGWGIVKLNSTGTFDTAFGSGSGKLRTLFGDAVGSAVEPVPFDMALQPDGKIVVAGRVNFNSTDRDFLIVRYENRDLPVFQFGSGQFNIGEGSGSALITLTRTGDSSSAASVAYATSNGTAKEGKDYVAAQGVLNFAAGETSKTFPVLIIDNAFVDGARSVNLSLSNPTGAILSTQSTAVLTLLDNDLTVGANPLDIPRSFVQLDYYDFLGRYPDQSGWDFWTSQITNCGSNVQCIEVQRINVSASFFLSIEFQQTGYMVERFYKVAFGNGTGNSTFGGPHTLAVPIIRFDEFLKDSQRVGRGVVVLAPGWEQLLESNKQAYALEFVQTSRFVAAFPTTLTPAQFVDQLNANAGNVLSASERTAVINLFGGAANSSNTTARAQAVRQVAEDVDLYNAEYNRAFVLAEYYGYLRRNPNDAPESTLDYTGYDFWLTKLNQFNGNYINAEMVKAFLSSIEYRQRFGP